MTNCPRLRAQIAAFLHMYAHLEADDLAQMRDYHCCAECHPLPEHLSREPEDRP